MPGIKINKPKTSVDSDATSTRKLTDLSSVANAHGIKISKMSDKQLMDDIVDNNIKGKSARENQAIDSAATRNIKRKGIYKEGTKGIKIKRTMTK